MRIARAVASLAAASLAAAACSQADAPLAPPAEVAFNHAGYAHTAHLEICKVGSATTFDITINGTTTTGVPFADGECKVVYDVPIVVGTPTPDVSYSVTENVPANTQLMKIVKVSYYLSDTPDTPVEYTGTNTVTGTIDDDRGDIVTFYNAPILVGGDGRMTGGGNPKINGVNLGLTLHCDITLSNNLEINWDGGNWHLSKPITSAVCLDDPAIDQTPPKAPFDTFIGEATGRLDGVEGSIVHFVFTDAGEPGKNDAVTIRIWAPGDDPATATPVLDVSGNLTHGNLQAHYDQPHK